MFVHVAHPDRLLHSSSLFFREFFHSPDSDLVPQGAKSSAALKAPDINLVLLQC